MPKITIGDLSFEVDKNFKNLSQSEQDKIIEDAVTQDAISGSGKAFASGLLFNFRDEVVAALSEPSAAISEFIGDGDAGAPYRQELTRQRALESAFRQQMPVTSTVAEIAGGFAAPGAALGQLARVPTLAGKALGAMGGGAVLGGLAGAGAGEEGTRLGSAGVGAGIGAAAGPVAMALPPLAGAVSGPVARTAGRLGEAAIRTPQGRAAKMVARRLKEAGVTGATLEVLKKSPKPEAIADIDSAGVHSLSRLVAQSGGRGSELARSLDVRQIGDDKIKSAAERIEQDLLDAGVPSQSALDTKAGLDQLKSSKVTPLYEQAHSIEVPQAMRDNLRSLFDRPAVRSAIPAAQRLAANEGKPISGNAIDNLDFAGFDYLQRALRQRADALYKQGKTQDAQAISAIRDEMVDVLKKNNKAFRKAFDLYGDTMGNQRALDLGQKFRTFKDADEITARLSKMSEAEKHHFRVGASQAIRQEIDRAGPGRNVADVIAKSKQQLSQLKKAFPEGGIEKLEKALDAERTMAATRQRTLGGSQTFQTTAEAQRAGIEDAGVTERAIEGVRQGGFFGGLAGAVQGRVVPAMMGVGPRTSKALGEILFETDPTRRAAAIQRVQDVGKIPTMPVGRESLAQKIGRQIGGVGGVASRGLLFDVPTTMAEEIYTTPQGDRYAITDGGARMTLLGD